MKPISLNNASFTGDFLGDKMSINRDITLDIEYKQCKDTGRIDALKLLWKEGMPNKPHFFWDSDLAKWIEAVAYSLMDKPNKELKGKVDDVIDLIEKSQWEDGYINSYYSVIDSDKRFTDIQFNHELYCAGHMIEAAVAWKDATGGNKFLNIMSRYADLIYDKFGNDDNKRIAYPGHQELELALVKLYDATNEEKYLKLAKFFIDERGKQPHFFKEESNKLNRDDNRKFLSAVKIYEEYSYSQAHQPVREQKTAEGHSVRALYLYSGMADTAKRTNDKELLKACNTLFDNIINKRMYITGGVGSNPQGERFSYDYDLPNENMYAETCANIALMFFASRMVNIELDSKYSDIMELALYNSVLSGVSLDGTRFFYPNPLTVIPDNHKYETTRLNNGLSDKGRHEWFGCACCPPNLARLLASLPQYAWSIDENGISAHLYGTGNTEFVVDNKKVIIKEDTRYPWNEAVNFNIECIDATEFFLSLRIPNWCENPSVLINGKAIEIKSITKNGYIKINRLWNNNDLATLILPMPVRMMEANPNVHYDCNKITIMKGPIVYCLEEVDNYKNLADIIIDTNSEFTYKYDEDLLNGVGIIKGKAFRRNWENNNLYRPLNKKLNKTDVKLIPYFAWANRRIGEMRVWLSYK